MICNISAVDRIYNDLVNQNDSGDLPETEDARKKLKAYLVTHLDFTHIQEKVEAIEESIKIGQRKLRY